MPELETRVPGFPAIGEFPEHTAQDVPLNLILDADDEFRATVLSVILGRLPVS